MRPHRPPPLGVWDRADGARGLPGTPMVGQTGHDDDACHWGRVMGLHRLCSQALKGLHVGEMVRVSLNLTRGLEFEPYECKCVLW